MATSLSTSPDNARKENEKKLLSTLNASPLSPHSCASSPIPDACEVDLTPRIFENGSEGEPPEFGAKVEALPQDKQTQAQNPDESYPFALVHSRSQRPVGRVVSVRTEFVFADPIASWNNWASIPMEREGENVYSLVVTLNRGYHDFCFLVDGSKLVLSSRHRSSKSTLMPGLTELNWRNVCGGRPVASQSAPAGRVAILREFLAGVGVLSVHDDSDGLPLLQGRLSFPSGEFPLAVPDVDNNVLQAKDLVVHLRVPILVLYVATLYFWFVGLAVLSRYVVW